MTQEATARAGEIDSIQSPLLLKQENLRLLARIAELERLVACDTLTPLFNRRHFMETLDRWCWRAHRYGGQYGLLYIDVDNLKAINDAHGHAAGDQLLVAIANALMLAIRRSDVAARIGGDEFAVLLDNMPEAELAGKVERLTRSIKKITVAFNGDDLTASVSIGYTPIEAGISSTELLLRADRSMYAAKDGNGAA